MTKYYLQGNIDGFDFGVKLNPIDIMDTKNIVLSNIANINMSTNESYLQQKYALHLSGRSMATSAVTGTLYFISGLKECYWFMNQVSSALSVNNFLYLKAVKDENVGISTYYCRVYPKFTSDISVVGNHIATVSVSFMKLSPWFSTPIEVDENPLMVNAGDMTPFFIARKEISDNTTVSDTFSFSLVDNDDASVVGSTSYNFRAKGSYKLLANSVIIDNGWDSTVSYSSLFVGIRPTRHSFRQTEVTANYSKYVPLNISMEYEKQYSYSVTSGYTLYVCYRFSNI